MISGQECKKKWFAGRGTGNGFGTAFCIFLSGIVCWVNITHFRISGNPNPETRNFGIPDIRISGNPESRISGFAEFRKSGNPKFRKSIIPKFRISENPEVRTSGNPEFRKSRLLKIRNKKLFPGSGRTHLFLIRGV